MVLCKQFKPKRNVTWLSRQKFPQGHTWIPDRPEKFEKLVHRQLTIFVKDLSIVILDTEWSEKRISFTTKLVNFSVSNFTPIFTRISISFTLTMYFIHPLDIFCQMVFSNITFFIEFCVQRFCLTNEVHYDRFNSTHWSGKFLHGYQVCVCIKLYTNMRYL